MKTLTILAGAGFMMLGTIGLAQAQVSGTPNSPFPLAAPNEVQIINGIPCRTILQSETNQRIPIQCATPSGMVGIGTISSEPMTTGSTTPSSGAPLSGTPNSPFPLAASNEVMIINGLACRTLLVPETQQRVPVECVKR
ncbi:hypothetical protein [Microvirga alba]|uniref:Secreted protein n=1 Tax=Microvirga alba TaxID=2791025 RepID=A0A931BQH4_9HYPH|nr:hypothetical protein [Microvirga alba]MBF9233799.1 hypothetical protein [Microvirga alba]